MRMRTNGSYYGETNGIIVDKAGIHGWRQSMNQMQDLARHGYSAVRHKPIIGAKIKVNEWCVGGVCTKGEFDCYDSRISTVIGFLVSSPVISKPTHAAIVSGLRPIFDK